MLHHTRRQYQLLSSGCPPPPVSLTRDVQDKLRALVLVEVNHVPYRAVRQRRAEDRDVVLRVQQSSTERQGKARMKRGGGGGDGTRNGPGNDLGQRQTNASHGEKLVFRPRSAEGRGVSFDAKCLRTQNKQENNFDEQRKTWLKTWQHGGAELRQASESRDC